MTTEKRDLRTGTPIWAGSRPPPVRRARLSRDITTDVLVVGAGISGAFMAERLSESRRVTVIDRRGIATGSTAASTALIASEIDTPLSLLGAKIGRERAVRAWQRSALAVRAIESRSAFLGVAEAGRLGVRDSLYLAGNVLDPAGLEEEGRQRRAAGLPAVFLPRRAVEERFGVRAPAGLLSFGDLTADPVRLARAYLKVAIGRGARVFAPVEARALETGRDGVVVATAGGPTIAAATVIFCTGYELPDFIRPREARVISTYAFATRPQARRLWPTRCLVWQASDPYLYVRETPDGRVICGGEDEDFADDAARDALIGEKTRTLSRKLGRLIPSLDPTPAFSWAGSFGDTETGLPLIGRVPRRRNCYAVLGFGGNGTTYSRIAADMIGSALDGVPDADADLFAF